MEKIKEVEERIAKIEKKQDDIICKLTEISQVLASIEYVNFELLNLDKTNKKNKVLICGFYGAYNYGDELMLETLLELFEKNKKIEITVLLENYRNYNTLSHQNVKYIHHFHCLNDLSIVSNYYDAIIFGGGALLDDVTYKINYRNEISLADTFIELSKLFISKNKKVYLLGLSSSNRITNEEYIENLNYIFKNATYVSLRDQNSINYMKTLGINTEKIHLDDDIIFANKDIYDFINNENKNNSKNIGLVLICNEDIYEINKKIVSDILNNTDYNIDLIPFYDYYNNDINYYTRILNEINNSRIKIEKYNSNTIDMLNTFSNERIMICERYHAALLSTMLSKKTISLVYNSHNHYLFKMNYVKENYNKNMEIVNLESLEKINIATLINKINKQSFYFDKEKMLIARRKLKKIINQVK